MDAIQANTSSTVYLIGGGIASLAAATFFIRDGGVDGRNIVILEESGKLGGSLDAAGSPEEGYVMRGGRMLESKYLCTFDLFSSIPGVDERKTVTQEIFEWNQVLKTSSKARLVRSGHRVTDPMFGLTEKHILTIERLGVTPEAVLGRTSIDDHFEPSFFETDFWFMWCTTFAFQPWHSATEFKRYLLRFVHMIAGFNTLGGIMRTVYNQYDSMIRPLKRWLVERGVRFRLDTRVLDLGFCHDASGYVVDRLLLEEAGLSKDVQVKPTDYVVATIGSMTESASFGSMDSAPVLKDKSEGGAWSLWEKLAASHPRFGHPANFTDHIDESKWVSFTVTLHDPTFFRLVQNLSDNVPGEGGLITFPDSSWLASIVLPHQPHFLGQPEDVEVFWGYGLFVDKPGDFVRKPMSECTGREILTEILGHLEIGIESSLILDTSTCIPCMMPFVTSQFLRRAKGDRPPVIPERSKNLALVGQFCELPDDVVFTVEYSVRSAQTAVYSLLRLQRTPPPVYKGHYEPRILLEAFRAFHDKGDETTRFQ